MLHMRRFDVECSCCIGVCVMSQVFVLHMCLCHFGSVRVVYVYVTLSVCFVYIYESQREGESQVKSSGLFQKPQWGYMKEHQ